MPLFSRASGQPTQAVYFVQNDQAQGPPAAPPTPRQPVADSPQTRYQINQRCIYERPLPGNAYVTAHVERLQPGIYEDVDNMSKSANHKSNVEKPKDGLLARSATVRVQSLDQGQAFGEHQDLSRPLRKKAPRDSSIRSEYVFAGQPRPASYHHGMGQLEDLKWPPSPSSISANSSLAKYPDTVFFLAIGFVLHPSDSLSHRFKSARVKINIDYADWTEPRIRRPKIIKYAPHLIQGAVSNATLNWTFNLTGSLGISQGPANASISPSTGFTESAVLSRMMKIQGSTRTTSAGIEDGELLWSFEENPLQKSGLPREFTFVMLIQVPRGQEDNVDFRMDIEPVIDTWYGSYPQFWQRRRCYQSLYKAPLNFHERIGQRFFSSTGSDGTADPLKGVKDYNFANMDGNLDDLVQLPGTTY